MPEWDNADLWLWELMRFEWKIDGSGGLVSFLFLFMPVLPPEGNFFLINGGVLFMDIFL